MHLVSLGIILAILISIFEICTSGINTFKKKKVIFAFLFGAFNFFLLIFYSLTIYGYFHWSAAFTLDLFNAYVTQLPKLLSIAGVSFLYASTLLLMFYISIFLLYIHISKFILINNNNIEKTNVINFKFLGIEFSLTSIACVRLMAISCIALYALTYKLWLPRDPFAIAMTNNWSLSNLAPRELFLPEFDFHKSEVQSYVKASGLKPRPLILITIDALRSDQLNVYGSTADNTPFLSSLFKKHQLQKYDVAHSICTLSFCGLLGILRSNYWSGLKKPSPTISDALKANNYQTIFLLGGDHTNFAGIRKFYGNNIDFYKDGSMDFASYPNDDFEVLKWVRDIDLKNSQSSFMFIHLMSVHEAGLRHEQFKKWQPSIVPLVSSLLMSSTPDKEYGVVYRNNYNNGILQADAMVRKIFEELKNKGILDNALVIISADHGEYLGEFNRFHHEQEPYEPVSRIPLLVYDPLNPHYPDRKLASQVDIGPTLLYAIGANIPLSWQGIPLQTKISRTSVSIESGEVSGTVALINGKKYKFLKKRDDRTEWLFDLNTPEAETRNIANLSEHKNTLLKIRALNDVSEK